MTLFDILLPNELRFIVVLPRKIGPYLQKMTLCALRVGTNLAPAMENTVKTYFIVLGGKKEHNQILKRLSVVL